MTHAFDHERACGRAPATPRQREPLTPEQQLDADLALVDWHLDGMLAATARRASAASPDDWDTAHADINRADTAASRLLDAIQAPAQVAQAGERVAAARTRLTDLRNDVGENDSRPDGIPRVALERDLEAIRARAAAGDRGQASLSAWARIINEEVRAVISRLAPAKWDRLVVRMRSPRPADDLGRWLATRSIRDAIEERAGNPKSRHRQRLLLAARSVEAPSRPDVVDDGEQLAAMFRDSLSEARFAHSPTDIVLDGAWRTSQEVEVLALPGAAPSQAMNDVRLDWTLHDPDGAPRTAGSVWWAADVPAAPPIRFLVDAPGEWRLAVVAVEGAHRLRRFVRTVVARPSRDDGDLDRLLGSNDLRSAVAAMSGADVGGQMAVVQSRLGAFELGGDRRRDAAYHRLRDAHRELQWETHLRRPAAMEAAAVESALGVDDARVASSSSMSSREQRAAVHRHLDDLIAAEGIEGARLRLEELEQEVANSDASIHGGSRQVAMPIEALRAELASREAEATAFLGRFDECGRSIAYGLLAESEGRIRGELARYGLHVGPAALTRDHRSDARTAPLDDLTATARAVVAAHASAEKASAALGRGETSPESVRARWADFESTRRTAVANHPSLGLYLRGEARTSEPGAPRTIVDAAAWDSDALGHFVAWELNQKLADIDVTRSYLADGELSVFGAPRLVELTRTQMRVAPGTMLDGVLAEHMRADRSGWTQELLAALSLGLGILLAIPTQGSSLAVSTVIASGELALLAADLFVIGSQLQQLQVTAAASNTDFRVADSLISAEPAAASLVLMILGVATGTGGAFGALSDLAQVGRAHHAIAQVQRVRQAAAAAPLGPELDEAVGALRASAAQAGMPDTEVDALVRTLTRRGESGTDIARARSAVRVRGMGEEPRTYPWRPNPDGAARSIDEAVAIARAHGVEIPDDITFLPRAGKHFPPKTFAAYFDRTFADARHVLHWDDFYRHAEDDIAVHISTDILSSDEAIVALFAHEMHELNGLRRLFDERDGGGITAGELRRLVNPGNRGNLHYQAWEVADRLVLAMRAKGALP